MKTKKIYGGGFSLEQRTEWTNKCVLCQGVASSSVIIKLRGMSNEKSDMLATQDLGPRIDQHSHKTSLIVTHRFTTHDVLLPLELSNASIFLSFHSVSFSVCKHLIALFLYYRCNCKLFSMPRVTGLSAPSRPMVFSVFHIAFPWSFPLELSWDLPLEAFIVSLQHPLKPTQKESSSPFVCVLFHEAPFLHTKLLLTRDTIWKYLTALLGIRDLEAWEF